MATTTTTTRMRTRPQTGAGGESARRTTTASPVARRSSTTTATATALIARARKAALPLLPLLLLLGTLTSAPRPASAALNCNGLTNKGFLSGFFVEQIHPTFLFGPSGLHGQTSQIPSSTTLFSVDVQRSLDSAVTFQYYPGSNYTIALNCGANECAFLATVEAGPRSSSGGAVHVDSP
jgi:hypothetical protein